MAHPINKFKVTHARVEETSKLNFDEQVYRGIKLHLIDRKYDGYKAKRYTLNGTNQNVWIPNKHLEEDGTLKPYEDIDYVFRDAWYQLFLSTTEGQKI